MFGWLRNLFPPLEDKRSLVTKLSRLESAARLIAEYARNVAFTLEKGEFDDIADRRIRHALQELLKREGESARELVSALSHIDSYAHRARKGRLYSGPPKPGLKGGG